MTPGAMMKLGAATVLVGLGLETLAPDLSAMPTILMAMGGAVFGKGYGVWEERNK